MRSFAAFLLGAVVLFSAGCRPAGTYSDTGEYVGAMQGLLDAFAAEDWDAYRAAYADSAQFHVNSVDAMTLDDRVAAHMAVRGVFTDVSVVDPVFGEAHTAEGEIWVFTWGLWQGTVRNTQNAVSVPIHYAVQFADGKAVEESIYVDLSPLEEAILQSEAALLGDPAPAPPQ